MRFDRSAQYSVVNGNARYFDELPTVHLYGMYDPADDTKTEFSADRISSTVASDTTAIFGVRTDENYIPYNIKPKYKCKKCSFTYNGSVDDFEEENIQVQTQGDSSLARVKKNLKLKFSTAHKIHGITKSKQYMLKADVGNSYHTQIGAWGNIWRQMMSARTDYDLLPEAIKNSNCKGALQALPVKVYYTYNNADGESITDFLGVYTMCEKKGDKMACFDGGSNPYAFLLSTVNCDTAGRSELCDDAGLYGKARPYAFSKPWTGSDTILENGFEFEDGGDDFKTEKIQFVNNIIDVVMNASDSEFKSTIVNYIDLTSFLDYIIYAYVATNSDATKNIMYYTTDYRTDKLFTCIYDFDNCDVSNIAPWNNISEDKACPYFQLNTWNPDNDLLARIMNNFYTELAERYEYLRESVLTPGNLSKYFLDEYSRVASMSAYETGYISDSGDYIEMPSSSATKYTNSWSHFPPSGKPLNTPDIKNAFTVRLSILDDLMSHISDLYPYALINHIDATAEVIHSTDTSINIFDYLLLRPKISGNYNAKLYANATKHVLCDDNGIVSSISDDGTIEFTENTGYADIRIVMNQIGANAIQGTGRYGGYWGIMQSPTIRVYHDAAPATTVNLAITNGEPYQFGKTVVVEATTDGYYDTITWDVSPSTAVYSVQGERLYLTTGPFTEQYSVECTCGSATGTLNITTVSPAKLYDRGDNSILCNNVKNLSYSTTVIEGEFSVDCMGGDDTSSRIGQFIFGSIGTGTYPKLLTDKFDGIGLIYKYRRFKDTYYLALQAFYGNKATAPLWTSIFSSGLVATMSSDMSKYILTPTIEAKIGEPIYFKICDDYVQINETKFPYVLNYAFNRDSSVYPMRLFAEQRTGTGAKGRLQSKKSIYYIKIYENGILTHHIKPNSRQEFQNTKKYVIDAVDTAGTFTPYTAPTTGSSSLTDWVYNGYATPSYANFGVLEYLDDNDAAGGVPLSGSNFVGLGFHPDNTYTYSVVFKPEFDCDSTWSLEDSRGCILGMPAYDYSTCRGNIDMSICVYNKTFCTNHKGTIVKSMVPCISGITYRIELTANTFVIYNNESGEQLGSVNINRTTAYLGTHELNLGATGMMEGSSSYNANNNTAISGFFGYIYSLNVFDGDGVNVMSLSPNSTHTGFIDSISGNEYLLYHARTKHDKDVVVAIDDKDTVNISGKKHQFSPGVITSNPIVSTGATNAYPANEPTKNVMYAFNLMSVASELRWKLEGKDADAYATIDKHTGLMTIYPSAHNTPVRVVYYWNVNPDVCDYIDVMLTYENT